MRFIIALIELAAGVLVAAPIADTGPPPILIRGAHVFDGSGSEARVRDVLIEGERIARVADRIPPRQARVIEGAGMTLLPGLTDLHIHTGSEMFVDGASLARGYAPYLAAGVTAINEYSVSPAMIPGIRALAADTPHLSLAARLGVPHGHGTESDFTNGITAQVTTPAEARAATRAALAARPDVIKVFADGWRYGDPERTDRPSMDLPTLAAIVVVAHRARVPVVTHTVTLAGAKIAARAKVDAVVHGIGDAPVDAELIRLMRRNRTGYVSTLVVYEPQATRVIESRSRRLLSSRALAQEAARMPGGIAAYGARRWTMLQANLKALHAAGIRIGVGTDSGIGGVYHGWATLREIEWMVRLGFTPAQALAAATSVSARIMHRERVVGRIARGQRADLILVGGRPDLRIEDLYDLRRVFVSGREVSVTSPDTEPSSAIVER